MLCAAATQNPCLNLTNALIFTRLFILSLGSDFLSARPVRAGQTSFLTRRHTHSRPVLTRILSLTFIHTSHVAASRR